MPFDPTKPVDDSLATAVEMRDQLNALKELFDDLQAQVNQKASQVQVDTQQTQMINMNSSIADLQDAVTALQGNH